MLNILSNPEIFRFVQIVTNILQSRNILLELFDEHEPFYTFCGLPEKLQMF